MRARGLKRERLPERYGMAWVAPHAGAWIETRDTTARCSRVFVAPHAGAWIETVSTAVQMAPCPSRPMRARGLKRPFEPRRTRQDGRAPCGRVD